MMHTIRPSVHLVAIVALLSTACSESPQYLNDSKYATDPGGDQTTENDDIRAFEAAALIVPEPFVPPAAYEALRQQLAASSQGRVAVEVLDLGGVVPSPQLVAQRASVAAENLAERTEGELVPSKIVLLAFGSAATAATAVVPDSTYGGLALVGAAPPEDVEAFPSPLLIIAGELDGLTNPLFLVDTAATLASSKDSTASLWLIEGANHGQLSGGATLEGDLEPSAEAAEVRQAVSLALVSFFEAHIFEPTGNDDALAASAVLTSATAAARSALAPFAQAFELEAQQWCTIAEETLVELRASQLEQMEITLAIYDNPDDFYGELPTLEVTKVKGQRPVAVVGALQYARPRKANSSWFSSVSVACKLRSQAAVFEALSMSPPKTHSSCADVNRAALAWAKGAVPQRVAERYVEQGIALDFNPDEYHTIGPQWKAAELRWKGLNKTPAAAVITSPALLADTWIPYAGGMHYCKVLSPATAMEWVWRESLRKTQAF
ncbi:MAG: hypothetical protein MUC50_07100 [Myxococcota bacterium]|nr:hypothetical protein [Myxococcota bacterium]